MKRPSLFAAALVLGIVGVRAQPAEQNQPPYVTEAQQKIRAGQFDAALEIDRKALQANPDSFQANNQAGVVLDLMGRYDEARKHFQKSLDVAAADRERAQAARSMAMSFAFTRDCAGAAKYEAPLYERYLSEKDYFNAGEIANELARVCLESNDLAAAEKWYGMGHEAGLKDAEATKDAAKRDLWEFRNEHALARIAARRGDKAGAQTHVAAAKAVLDTGTNPEQATFFPYLTGYVAYYLADYKTAIADLQSANQNDPFILALLGQAFEKSGDKAQAIECFRKALAIPAHNPTGAYARPIAQSRVGATKP